MIKETGESESSIYIGHSKDDLKSIRTVLEESSSPTVVLVGDGEYPFQVIEYLNSRDSTDPVNIVLIDGSKVDPDLNANLVVENSEGIENVVVLPLNTNSIIDPLSDTSVADNLSGIADLVICNNPRQDDQYNRDGSSHPAMKDLGTIAKPDGTVFVTSGDPIDRSDRRTIDGLTDTMTNSFDGDSVESHFVGNLDPNHNTVVNLPLGFKFDSKTNPHSSHGGITFTIKLGDTAEANDEVVTDEEVGDTAEVVTDEEERKTADSRIGDSDSAVGNNEIEKQDEKNPEEKRNNYWEPQNPSEKEVSDILGSSVNNPLSGAIMDLLRNSSKSCPRWMRSFYPDNGNRDSFIPHPDFIYVDDEGNISLIEVKDHGNKTRHRKTRVQIKKSSEILHHIIEHINQNLTEWGLKQKLAYDADRDNLLVVPSGTTKKFLGKGDNYWILTVDDLYDFLGIDKTVNDHSEESDQDGDEYDDDDELTDQEDDNSDDSILTSDQKRLLEGIKKSNLDLKDPIVQRAVLARYEEDPNNPLYEALFLLVLAELDAAALEEQINLLKQKGQEENEDDSVSEEKDDELTDEQDSDSILERAGRLLEEQYRRAEREENQRTSALIRDEEDPIGRGLCSDEDIALLQRKLGEGDSLVQLAKDRKASREELEDSLAYYSQIASSKSLSDERTVATRLCRLIQTALEGKSRFWGINVLNKKMLEDLFSQGVDELERDFRGKKDAFEGVDAAELTPEEIAALNVETLEGLTDREKKMVADLQEDLARYEKSLIADITDFTVPNPDVVARKMRRKVEELKDAIGCSILPEGTSSTILGIMNTVGASVVAAEMVTPTSAIMGAHPIIDSIRFMEYLIRQYRNGASAVEVAKRFESHNAVLADIPEVLTPFLRSKLQGIAGDTQEITLEAEKELTIQAEITEAIIAVVNQSRDYLNEGNLTEEDLSAHLERLKEIDSFKKYCAENHIDIPWVIRAGLMDRISSKLEEIERKRRREEDARKSALRKLDDEAKQQKREREGKRVDEEKFVEIDALKGEGMASDDGDTRQPEQQSEHPDSHQKAEERVVSVPLQENTKPRRDLSILATTAVVIRALLNGGPRQKAKADALSEKLKSTQGFTPEEIRRAVEEPVPQPEDGTDWWGRFRARQAEKSKQQPEPQPEPQQQSESSNAREDNDKGNGEPANLREINKGTGYGIKQQINNVAQRQGDSRESDSEKGKGENPSGFNDWLDQFAQNIMRHGNKGGQPADGTRIDGGWVNRGSNTVDVNAPFNPDVPGYPDPTNETPVECPGQEGHSEPIGDPIPENQQKIGDLPPEGSIKAPPPTENSNGPIGDEPYDGPGISV